MGITSKMSPELLFSCVLLGMVGFIAVITNCLVLRTMITCEKIRNSLFVICSGIAFADILYVVLVIPVEIINSSQEPHVINERLCKTISYLAHTAHYVCVYLVVGLTIVRAIFLTTRIAPGPTALKGLAVTITIWVIGLLANIPMLDYQTVINKESGNCLLPAMIDYRSSTFTYVTISFSYFVPVAMIIIVYVVTYIICRRYCENTHSEEDRRMARLITGVVSTFVIIWLPLHLLIIFTLKQYQEKIENVKVPLPGDEIVTSRLYIAVNFIWALSQIDKCMRPLIYMGMSVEFKRSYNEIVDCTLCCNSKDNNCDNNNMSLSQLQPLNKIDQPSSTQV